VKVQRQKNNKKKVKVAAEKRREVCRDWPLPGGGGGRIGTAEMEWDSRKAP